MRKATHKGILPIGGAELPCFVLDDGTRVISGRGVTQAIGMKGRGQGVSRIVTHKTLKPFLDNELVLAIENPLMFDSGAPLPTQGYPADILVQLCEAILKARDDNKLITEQEKRYARACDVLVRAFAHVGIVALVDEATGYQEVRDRLALQAILDKYLLAERAKWAKRFPDDFYKEMFRLRNWQWKGMQVGRPSVVGHYTNNVVWERLAPGVLSELRRLNPKDERGRRKGKHHQWLTEDIGHPALAQHLHAVLGLMRASTNWDQFNRLLQRAFPKLNSTLDLPYADSEN
jgi:hypothetical protein